CDFNLKRAAHGYFNLSSFFSPLYAASYKIGIKWLNQDIPFGQKWISLQSRLDLLHGFLSQGNTFRRRRLRHRSGQAAQCIA
ncbi:MAG: hypothetical protein V7K48_25125, partial [Nostoc sp.]|uniref:hypothetical protein n=1 Tax=Nostoc sp. TaxID=1180 RepID=UPI002FF9B145